MPSKHILLSARQWSNMLAFALWLMIPIIGGHTSFPLIATVPYAVWQSVVDPEVPHGIIPLCLLVGSAVAFFIMSCRLRNRRFRIWTTLCWNMAGLSAVFVGNRVFPGAVFDCRIGVAVCAGAASLAVCSWLVAGTDLSVSIGTDRPKHDPSTPVAFPPTNARDDPPKFLLAAKLCPACGAVLWFIACGLATGSPVGPPGLWLFVLLCREQGIEADTKTLLLALVDAIHFVVFNPVFRTKSSGVLAVAIAIQCLCVGGVITESGVFEFDSATLASPTSVCAISAISMYCLGAGMGLWMYVRRVLTIRT